jgi:hypothetical protein
LRSNSPIADGEGDRDDGASRKEQRRLEKMKPKSSPNGELNPLVYVYFFSVFSEKNGTLLGMLEMQSLPIKDNLT